MRELARDCRDHIPVLLLTQAVYSPPTQACRPAFFGEGRQFARVRMRSNSPGSNRACGCFLEPGNHGQAVPIIRSRSSCRCALPHCSRWSSRGPSLSTPSPSQQAVQKQMSCFHVFSKDRVFSVSAHLANTIMKFAAIIQLVFAGWCQASTRRCMF